MFSSVVSSSARLLPFVVVVELQQLIAVTSLQQTPGGRSLARLSQSDPESQAVASQRDTPPAGSNLLLFIITNIHFNYATYQRN